MHEYASIHNFKQRVSGVRVGVQNFKITSLMIKLSRGSGPKYISEFSFQMLSMKKLYLRQFSTKLCKGMSHEMIIDQLKETIDLEQVKSVQLTENSCIVSVEDSETKDKLIINGLTLKNRSVSFLDVEKTITNVTIKDMQYEVQNCFVATQMLRYGQVIPESVRRGYIKGTNIENGSRYLQNLTK